MVPRTRSTLTVDRETNPSWSEEVPLATIAPTEETYTEEPTSLDSDIAAI